MGMKVPNMDDVYACLQCGYCRTICPVYKETGWESLTPRGKVYFMKQLAEKGFMDKLLRRKINPSDEWIKKMFTCTLCSRCEVECHVNIEFHEFWEEAKKWMVEKGYGPPQSVRDMHDNIEKKEFLNPFMEPKAKRDEWYKDDYKLPYKADVLYFPGCMASYYEYQVLLNTMKILSKSGIEFTTLGQDEKCCGAINLMTGQFDTFKGIAQHNVSEIERRGARTVITGCPGCYRALIKYRKYVGKMDFEIVHTAEFLHRLIKEGKIEFSKSFKEKNLPIVYHDPCELGRIAQLEGRGIFDEPREVLKSVPGIEEFLEFKNNRMDSECCGGGGGLKAVDYDLTTKITARKVDEAIELGARTIVSTCANCKSQISIGVENMKEAMKAQGKKLKMNVMDIADVVAKAM